MVADQVINNGITAVRRNKVRNGRGVLDRRWRRPVVVLASLTAGAAFAGWVAVLALTLPSRYLASHWNVAWVGFDLMLLVSLLFTAWALVMRRRWASSALMVSATLLFSDVWFDVTTTSGARDTLVSVGLAGIALPAAAGLAWAAARASARSRATSPAAALQEQRAREGNGVT
jgi:hypothetical protein